MPIQSVKDVEAVLALQGKNAGLIVGQPPETETSASAVALTGTIDGSNKDFLFPMTHVIFPKSCVSTKPVPADITVWLKKGSTYTEATVASISKAANTLTGRQEYIKVSLSTAPSTETADTVHGLCVRQLEPYIQQNVKIEGKQDESDYGQLRSDLKHKLYGAVLETISQDALLGDLDILLDLFYEEYDGTETVPVDMEAFTRVSEPKIIYAYIPLERGTEIVGFIMFPQVRAVLKTLLDVKEGDKASYAMELPVDKKSNIVRPIA